MLLHAEHAVDLVFLAPEPGMLGSAVQEIQLK